MDHSIHLAGHAYRLRPIRVSDAAFIVELRKDPERTRFINPIEPSVSGQEEYLRGYLKRDDDYYFVVEDKASGSPEGLIALYDYDPVSRQIEAGRWVMRPGSMAAVESLLLIYRVAFEIVGVQDIVVRILQANGPVVSFQESCGLELRKKLPKDVQIRGEWVDRVEFGISLEQWPVIRARMEQLATKVT